MRQLRIISGIVSIGILLCISACYPTSMGFKDNSLDPALKNFSIITFTSSSPNAPVNYPPNFTEYLKTGIQNNTRLSLVKTEGTAADLIFSGEVIDYSIMPISIQGNSEAAKNRLTIGLKIFVENKQKPEKSFEVSPRRFADYDAGQDISSVESQLIDEINEQLLQDILNKLQSDW
jgi:hypothetical protein